MYTDIVSGKIEEAEISFGSIYFFVTGEDRCQTHQAEMNLVEGQLDGQYQDDQAAELGAHVNGDKCSTYIVPRIGSKIQGPAKKGTNSPRKER